MNPRPNRARLLVAILLFVSVGLLLANFGGRVSRAQGGQVQVTAADPASTTQGTINLNVKVNGKGFKNGAKAKWYVAGTTDPGGVTVNSTTFVSSTEVTANITVADTAAIASFDIQVTNSDGRGGKGTELFSVIAKQNALYCPPQQPAPIGDTRCYAALPGCLDSTFGGLGFVNVHIDNSHDAGEDVVVQPDGKIVVAGNANINSDTNFAVVRYNADGGLDTAFGDIAPLNPALRLGYTITPITTASDSINAIARQSDGKLVVVGTASGVDKVAVVRYNSNGTLDNTFGSGGKALLNFGKSTAFPSREIAIQSDGKIVIGGGAKGPGGSVTSGYSVARLLANGSLDPSFGSGGSISVNPSGINNGYGAGWGMAIQRVPASTGEERIVIGGGSGSSSSNQDWTLMRFKSNGATDTTFGSAGIVKTPFTAFGAWVSSVKIDSSNRIVAAGKTRTADVGCGGYSIDYAVARYSENGSIDSSFAGGKQTVDIYGGMDQLYGLAVQLDNKILMVGYAGSSDGTVTNIALVRFNADGSRDSSFGIQGNGVTTLDLYGFADYGIAVALQPNDGRIIVAGSTVSAAGEKWDIVAARFLP